MRACTSVHKACACARVRVHEEHVDRTLPTFTGNRVDPETFFLSHSGLELPVECYGKLQLSTIGRHDGKLRTCMEGE